MSVRFFPAEAAPEAWEQSSPTFSDDDLTLMARREEILFPPHDGPAELLTRDEAADKADAIINASFRHFNPEQCNVAKDARDLARCIALLLAENQNLRDQLEVGCSLCAGKQYTGDGARCAIHAEPEEGL